MKKEINICDVCEKNPASRVCLTCNKDLCGNEMCSARSYFDKYIPYELERDYDFCKECAKSFGYLSQEELKEWFGVSSYKYSDLVNSWLTDEFKKIKANLKQIATEKFKSAILKSQEIYKNKIEKEQKEKEIKEEIAELDKRKQELQGKII